MSARIPRDPEPWLEFDPLDGSEQRFTEDVTGTLIRAPRPVILASTPDREQNVLRLHPDDFESVEYGPRAHPANPAILAARTYLDGQPPGDHYWASVDAFLGQFIDGYTPFEVAHARAVLTRLGNVDWEGWRA